MQIYIALHFMSYDAVIQEQINVQQINSRCKSLHYYWRVNNPLCEPWFFIIVI